MSANFLLTFCNDRTTLWVKLGGKLLRASENELKKKGS